MNKEEGWRQCAKGQRTPQFCALLEEAVQAEREACAKKEAMNKLSPQNELTLWVGATHYHLGRTTYAVSDFCNLLIGSWNELGENTKKILQRFIEEEFRRDDEFRARGDSYRPLGHDCDRKSWEQVRKLWSLNE